MIRRRFAPCLLVGLLLALTMLPTAGAQELPATPVPAKAPTGVLARQFIEELPTPHGEVWFIRMGLEPGGSLPAGKQIGPVVTYVESGQLTLVSDRPVTVSTASEPATPAVVSPTSGTEGLEVVIQPGESALIGDGATLLARNNADEPTTFLMVSTYAAEREGELGQGGGEPIGLTQQAISIAVAEFPTGPGTLTIERIVVDPGNTLESDSGNGRHVGGIDLGAIEQGSADVTFKMGSSWLWPNILN